jgi:hypothetical protein
VESKPRGRRFKPPYGGAAFETFQKCRRSSIFVKNKFDGYHLNFFRHLCELVLRHQMRVLNYFVNSFYSVPTLNGAIQYIYIGFLEYTHRLFFLAKLTEKTASSGLQSVKCTLQRKGQWESNINVCFPFMYSQKWNFAALFFPKQNYNVLSPNSYCKFYVWFIYFQDRSAYFAAAKYVEQSWEYTNHSQTHKCRNCDWGRAIPFLGIHKLDFRYSAAADLKQSSSAAKFHLRSQSMTNCLKPASGLQEGRSGLLTQHGPV